MSAQVSRCTRETSKMKFRAKFALSCYSPQVIHLHIFHLPVMKQLPKKPSSSPVANVLTALVLPGEAKLGPRKSQLVTFIDETNCIQEKEHASQSKPHLRKEREKGC